MWRSEEGDLWADRREVELKVIVEGWMKGLTSETEAPAKVPLSYETLNKVRYLSLA